MYATRCVYIAGKYSGKDYNEIDRNIALAREAASEFSLAGVRYFSPHQHAEHMEAVVPSVSYEYWIDLDLYFLEKCCNAILFLPGWLASSGARNEFVVAKRLGFPLFFNPSEAIEWWQNGKA